MYLVSLVIMPEQLIKVNASYRKCTHVVAQQSRDTSMLLNKREVAGSNLTKKNETNIFPVRTEQATSIKFLL